MFAIEMFLLFSLIAYYDVWMCSFIAALDLFKYLKRKNLLKSNLYLFMKKGTYIYSTGTRFSISILFVKNVSEMLK